MPKPVHEIRRDGIKAAIWENTGAKGTYFSVTIVRPYKTATGVWTNGTSFGSRDLEAVISVAREAQQWIEATNEQIGGDDGEADTGG